MSVLSMMSSLSDQPNTVPPKPTPIAILPKRSPTSSSSTPGTAAGDCSATNNASAATNPGHADASEPTCMPYTCLTCARRKVKCDKLSPRCSTCQKAKLECAYQSPAPRKRKRKGELGAAGAEQNEIEARLELYERILRANGLFPGEEGQASEGKNLNLAEPQWPFLLSTVGSQQQSNVGGKLVGQEGRSRYIGSTVFKNLGEDLEPSEDEEDDEPEEGDGSSAPMTSAAIVGGQGRMDPLSAAFLSPGGGSSAVGLLDYHPTYDSALRLWRLYVDNVDPIVKAVHVPTMQTILQRSAAQPSGIPRATEALLFSIYHFGVVSIDDEQCLKMFGESRTALLGRYEAALRQALVNAQWMRSLNLQVVQAFILFLLSVRSTYDPQSFWILTGCAVRMAQRLGLHRDGEELGLKPFDTQMRRRIFWQLLPLDGMAGQFSGTGICITLDSWTTKQMLNLNDADIYPSMTETPEPHVGATDMIFCLARTEMAKIIRTAFTLMQTEGANKSADDYDVKASHLSALEDEIESKYLRYCDFGNPVHQVTMAMSRAGINGGRLRIRLAKAKNLGPDLPDSDRRETWAIANKIIDYHIQANTNTSLQRFWWHIKAFFQSEALAWVLTELRRDPARYEAEREATWDKIERTYSNHSDLEHQKRSLHLAVGRLTLKAWDATQEYLRSTNQAVMEEKKFIERVRFRAGAGRKDSSAAAGGVGSTSTYGGSSSNPTPGDSQGWPQYNPFNPGDASEDLTWPSAKYGSNNTYSPGNNTANTNYTPYTTTTFDPSATSSSSTTTQPTQPSFDGTFGGYPSFPGLQGSGAGLLFPTPVNSFDFDFNFNQMAVDQAAGGLGMMGMESIDWMFLDGMNNNGGGQGGFGSA